MRLLRRLAYWLRLSGHDAELTDELRFHRDMIERDLVQRGMSPAAARAQARRTMGNETFMREEARAVWLPPALEALWQDTRYALRGLRRTPTFTLGIALTLALGIGANTAMFSLVDRLLFRPPALMRDPASVNRIYLYRTSQGVESGTGSQYPRQLDIARWSRTSAQTARFTLKSLATGIGDATRIRRVGIVSASFFGFFDAPPVLGRYFTAAEDTAPDPAAVVVISQSLWTTQYAASRDVLGRTLHVDAVAYTIIGVAPGGFVGLWPYTPPAAFIPVATFARSVVGPDWATTYGSAFGLQTMSRRKPEATVAAATADFTEALRRSFLAERGPTSLDELRPRAVAASVLAERGPEATSVARVSTWLFGVTLIVLLIACANVANVTLARTIRRRREIALRIAMGVSRRRLFSQLLTEGMLLALLGGALGVVLAAWSSRLLTLTFLPATDRLPHITDARTLVFTGAVAVTVGLLTGLAPMAQVGRGNLAAHLKAGVREGTHQRGVLRSVLLLVQTGLSVVLLVGAGLFVRSLQHAHQVPLGFDADSVLLAEMSMREVTLDSAATALLRLRLLDAAKEVPGVSYASLQESTPFQGMSSYPLVVPGIDSVRRFGEFDVNAVSAEYFNTMGTRIVRGRAFENTDREGGQRVMVVGASMAAVLWPGQDAIGRCIKVWKDTTCRYVVGVAEDIHSQSLDTESRLYFYYMPAAQWRPEQGGLFVRARGDPARLIEPLRQRLQREMPGASFVTVTPLADGVNAAMRSWIVAAKVFSLFGALALVLAAVGLYSVIAYNTAQRRHELGVRLALGAARSGIVRLVVTGSVRVALGGVTIGAVAALAAGRWIAPLLFRQSPRDPAVFAVVCVVLIAVAVVASALPAWYAARLDPRTALQAD